MTVTVGEQRHSSVGNVYQLVRVDGPWRYVRRIANGTDNTEPLWDSDITYRWHAHQWEEQLPLVGDDGRDYLQFGLFVPHAAAC